MAPERALSTPAEGDGLSAVLLVGGRGTRLQPLTNTRPKPMLPVVDAPFLRHQLAHLYEHGVRHVTFACGFLPNQIVAHFGDGASLGMDLRYVVEPEPLGTGGAIGFAARSLQPQTLIVCNGDVLTELDVTGLVEFHRQRSSRATIALTPVDDPSRYGLVRTNDDGQVLAFLEKPKAEEIDTNLINAGTYVIEPEVLELIPHQGACSVERDVFPSLIGSALYACASDAYWLDVGTVESYLRGNVDLLRGRVRGAGTVPECQITVADDAQVDASAQLHSPCWIGPGVRVAEGASVGPDAVLSAGAVVEPAARVSRAVVLERATIEREAQVVDSIVGEDATIVTRTSLTDLAVAAPGARVDAAIVRGG